MKKHVIYSDYICSEYFEATEEFAKEEDYDVYDLLESAWEDLFYSNDERADIIVIGDLGFWDGRAVGYKELSNMQDCFRGDCDFSTWFIDEHKNLRYEGMHHDGTNHYLYRRWKDGLSWEQKDNFMYKLVTGKATSRDVTRYTKAIGSEIKGW